MAENNIYFRKLNLDEKKSKLQQLSKAEKSSIYLWVRGQNEKTEIEVISFNEKDFSFKLKNISDSMVKEKNLLFTFYLNKVQYFGEGDIKSLDDTVWFSCSYDVYKTEKRESFRLLSYPHHEVYFMVEVDKKDKNLDKVVNIRTGKNEDELFDSFLDLLAENSSLRSGFAKFRVIDVSVTGLAFQYGKEEEDFIENLDGSQKKGVLDFEGKDIPLSGFEFIYKGRKQNKEAALKAGIRFVNMSTNTEEVLGMSINKAMRK